MAELFKLIGLGVPFYLGAATYAVFAWLDNNASEEATKVISSWLHGRSKNKPDLGNLIINAFDRIYTSPLLSFRAFRRSAAITTIVWLLIFLIPVMTSEIYTLIQKPPLFASIIVAFSMSLLTIVLVDYMSLLFVRQFLNLAQLRPTIVSFLSLVVGSFVVIFGFMVIRIMQIQESYWLLPSPFIGEKIPRIQYTVSEIMLDFSLPTFFLAMKPALVVHLWLPLFALSSLVVRLVFWIFRAVEWAQWFLKQGDAHPLKAIGMVATIIVFGSAMLVKEGWALLSVLERS